jgi:anaerobic ribonucleoside-triphosphate reductase
MSEEKSERKVKTEVYSRISGYYRPVAQWNKGKQAERSERVDLLIPREVTDEVAISNDTV